MTWVAVATVGAALLGSYTASKQGGKNRRMSAQQAAQALKERKEQQARVDKEVANYRAMKFTNPYEGMKNVYENMENVFEDLRVSTQAADFQAEQGGQQRANILAQLRESAGGSGIAALAQSMANQGQLQARQISSDLSRQQAANEMARARGAGMIQQAERGGAAQIQQMERQGDAMVQQAETGRQATILGAMYGQSAGANANYQQAIQNQANANRYADQMQNEAMMQGLQTLATTDFSSLGGGGANASMIGGGGGTVGSTMGGGTITNTGYTYTG